MDLELSASLTLDLDPRCEWVWYSPASSAFLAGDERRAFAVPEGGSGAVALASQAPPGTQCDLPVPAELYREFAEQAPRGLRWLPAGDYQAAGSATLGIVNALVFGPNGTYVEHAASGAVLSLTSGSMKLLRRGDGGFEAVGETRTRGKSALAFAAHPEEALLVYGDNYGTCHAHQFSAEGFGKATKIEAYPRQVSDLCFIDGGETLLIGGMGFLTAFRYDGQRFVRQHEVSIAVRELAWVKASRTLVVNQGLHGVVLYRLDHSGFTRIAGRKFEWAVDRLSVSADGSRLALLEKYQSWPATGRCHLVTASA